jgi:hypothetical protein
MESHSNLADDILEGADAIAEFLFGSKEERRRIYYLAETSKLPLFRLGAVLCARKSVLLNYITSQENRVLAAFAAINNEPASKSTQNNRFS